MGAAGALRCTALLAAVCVVGSADPSSPHAHSGVLKPYVNGPMEVSLTSSELKQLEAGRAVMRMNAEKTSGVAVQDVDAPVDVVLRQVSTVEKYPGKVPGLSSVRNYERSSKGDAVRTKSTYVLSIAMGYKLEYYIDHLYVPKHRCLTWTLDYSRKSDVHDSVGYWRADPLPPGPGGHPRTRVFYSSSSLVRGMPQFVMDILTSQALKASTAWVKRFSEEEAGPGPAVATAPPAAGEDGGQGAGGRPGPLSLGCAFALAYADITDPKRVAECERAHVGSPAAGGGPSPAGKPTCSGARGPSSAWPTDFGALAAPVFIISILAMYASCPGQGKLQVLAHA